MNDLGDLQPKPQRSALNRKDITRRLKRAGGVTQRHARRFILRRINSVRLVTGEIITWLAVVGILVATLGLQQTWGNVSAYMQGGYRSGGVYAEGIVGSLDTLNPLLASNEAEASAARLMFSSLYHYDTTGALHADVASSMTIRDSKIYTVTLRDATWQDGHALTADDVVYTIGLIKNPQTRSPLRVNWTDAVVKKINQHTVEFTLPTVYAAFPHALTFPIVPKHLLQNVEPSVLRESSFSQNPIGSGPFKFRRLQTAGLSNASKVLQLVPHTEYYNTVPRVSRFELRAYTDDAAFTKAIKNSEVTGAVSAPAALAHGKRPSQYRVISEPLNKGVYLLFNTRNPVLQDKTVRQALQLATDTAAIHQAVGGGVQTLDGPILHSMFSSGEVPRASKPNAEKAAQLLDSAGWRIKNGVRYKGDQELKLTITTTNSSQYSKIIDTVKRQWSAVGVLVDVNQVDTNSAVSNFVQGVLQPRNFDVLLYELALGADPDVYAYWHSSQASATGYNFSNYSNQLSDAALASARTRLESNLRMAKYAQFVRQWLSDVPAIALYQASSEYLVNTNAYIVKPKGSLPELSDRYARVSEWSVSPATVYKTP